MMRSDTLIDRHHKSFPLTASPVTASGIAARGWHLLADDLAYPLAVLRRPAVEHNLQWMQDFAHRKGVELAPHGKTTMSPELFALQLQAGAWGLTFATVYQVSVGAEAGARKIIIANQVVCDADLDGLDALLQRHEGLRVWFLVDSLAQLQLMQDWAQRRGNARCFDVLLEMGVPGQRTGKCESEHDAREVTALVRRVLDAAKACDDQKLFADEEILLTAGGSAVFDLVVPLLRAQNLSKPVRGVLRSGCYVTHDHGNYARFLKNVEQREGLKESLQPALEVWAMVQSVPEPGLALLTCGRRDVSYDLEMPIPIAHAPRGARSATDSPAGWTISALNDQHAYLRYDPAGTAPQVGDRVGLGISHPCTTFDKWRWMPVIEDDGAITGAVHTRF